MIIQGIIIVAAAGMLFLALNGPRTHFARAWKKIGLSLLPVAMIIAVLFPESTNKLASVVGVGRGADLLLYLLTLAFIGYALNTYLYQQDERDALYRLARKVALLDAAERYNDRKK